MTHQQIMPAFIFGRRRDIELEAGFVLAGSLIVDIPKRAKAAKLKRRHERMITNIVEQLIDMARSGQMPDDAIIFGWPRGIRPTNADDIVDNDKLMAAWARERIQIAIRIDPRNDGLIRMDSDIARQIGLTQEH
jgi:hypothetical protein